MIYIAFLVVILPLVADSFQSYELPMRAGYATVLPPFSSAMCDISLMRRWGRLQRRILFQPPAFFILFDDIRISNSYSNS